MIGKGNSPAFLDPVLLHHLQDGRRHRRFHRPGCNQITPDLALSICSDSKASEKVCDSELGRCIEGVVSIVEISGQRGNEEKGSVWPLFSLLH